jgi:hypothetical protein
MRLPPRSLLKRGAREGEAGTTGVDTRSAVAPTSTVLAAATAAALVALVGIIAADSLWLAALGEEIVESGAIPAGVPYAAADSSGWPNVLVLAELIFYVLAAALGEHGLLLAQTAAVAACFIVVGRDMRRAGATDSGAGALLLLLIPAAFPALVAVRVQLFSLPLFALLALLLRAEARTPSRRIWLLVPLLALWANLHGAVLVGLAAAGAYLLLERVRVSPATALAALAASAASVCLTPALLRTPEYFVGVLESEAARRGAGLWEQLSPTSLLGAIFIAGATVVLFLALKARPAPWELAVLAGLAIMSVRTERSGIWLLLFAAVPAAAAVQVRGRVRSGIAGALGAVLGVLVVAGLVQGAVYTGAGDRLLTAARNEAAGTPILADPLVSEQLALAGVTIWIGNPLDAFRREQQRLYLDWTMGLPAGDRALAHAPRAVLVQLGSDAQVRLAAGDVFREAARDARSVLYVRISRR